MRNEYKREQRVEICEAVKEVSVKRVDSKLFVNKI